MAVIQHIRHRHLNWHLDHKQPALQNSLRPTFLIIPLTALDPNKYILLSKTNSEFTPENRPHIPRRIQIVSQPPSFRGRAVSFWKINGWNPKITCLKRKIIYSKPSWLWVQAVNLQRCIRINKTLVKTTRVAQPPPKVQVLNVHHHQYQTPFVDKVLKFEICLWVPLGETTLWWSIDLPAPFKLGYGYIYIYTHKIS